MKDRHFRNTNGKTYWVLDGDSEEALVMEEGTGTMIIVYGLDQDTWRQGRYFPNNLRAMKAWVKENEEVQA